MSSASPSGSTQPLIERDCPCIRCGYNLRTLAADSACPECETPVEATLRARADHLAGADRRWLRAITSGVLWLTLSMFIPAVFLFVPLFDAERASERRADWINMGIIFTPAILALVACWRLGSRERSGREPGGPDPDGGEPRGGKPGGRAPGDDQLFIRAGLRLTSILWLAPLPLIASLAGGTDDPRFNKHWPLLSALGWTALPATLLLFARLKHVARRIPSRSLELQCAAIGSQLPVGMVLLSILVGGHFHNNFRLYPDVMSYAAMTPVPGAGSPWLLVLSAGGVLALYPRGWMEEPIKWLIAWPIVLSIATLAFAVQFLIVLIRVRRQNPELPAYCREMLRGTTPVSR